jgi:hypothetical protein
VVNVFIHRFLPGILVEQHAEQRWWMLKIKGGSKKMTKQYQWFNFGTEGGFNG